MGVDAASLVGGAMGGAALQSVLGPLVGQRHLRRDLRAAVRRAIGKVERDRWASAPRESFRQSVAELHSAMLASGLPRQLGEFYVEVASGARMISERDWKEMGGGDEEVPGGIIPSQLNDLVAAAKASLVGAAWHPYRTRTLRRWRLKMLEARRVEVTEELADEPRDRIDWKHVWVPS